ncbi:uncharacterized protein K02A2.6-like [Teleopsis dalmanni]|uniref:uncharacterized protein K02A2.6-like n=1 Tax=Teleopsis dalmanni TaxID=139649 RepID=UPI0018CD409C|nr:uncharacterized protein K02A2.6-like [Teleopsis dalmanni]
MIRDKVIVNTPHDVVRINALQKTNPTLSEVMLTAEAFESTEKTINKIKGKLLNDEVCVVKGNEKNKNRKDNAKQTMQEKSCSLKSCSSCGILHTWQNCKFRKVLCRKCGRKGHITSVCMSAKSNINQIDQQETTNSEQNSISQINSILNVENLPQRENKKVFINILVDNTQVKFQMDSGATVSVLTQDTYEHLNKPQLYPCKKELFDYGKNKVKTLGEFCAVLKCGEMKRTATLVVVCVRNGHNLFGTDLFELFGFEIRQIAVINNDSQLNEVLEKHRIVFEPALGTIKQVKARLHLKQGAVPKFCKSRPIPFAQFEKFKTEAQRLRDRGIWKPIKFSQWASPIVLVTKPDGSLRICGDFKTTVNKQIDVDQYPLPTRESLFHMVRYGKFFSKIDLKDAYLQMELDDKAKNVLVVNIPLRLFQYQRLPFGIASAPALFQKYIEQLIHGTEECGNYIDDIIIAAETVDIHLKRLAEILSLLAENGIRCRRTKCEFLVEKLEYLGRTISASGILPDEKGVQAVKQLPRPKNVKEVEAFLGKRHIIEATELSHFQEHLPIVLATDASSYGIGAVIAHRHPDGSERPIAFASKTLNTHQVRYSQIEKEALSIIFGVTRFHQYLFGHKFILVTDHKPLVSIFSPDKNLPSMSTHRLQRWAIILMSYQFEIQYRRTADHSNADALSRLPCGPDPEFDKFECCHQIENYDTPINVKLLQQHYKDDRTDVTRVVVPKSLHQSVLKLLHEGHWGVVKMKQLARQHCWWHQIDDDIEKLAAQCNICQIAGTNPNQQYHEWPKPERPWQRVHIDFAGPVFNSMWLIVVDAFSQFPFVVQLKTTTSMDAIAALSTIFSLEGLPETIVTPFHPASNGLAERFVRTFKTSVKKNVDDGLSLTLALVKYLATYRAIPNAEGKSPAELLHGRTPRILLALLSASINNDKTVKCSTKFLPNEKVYVRHYGRGPKWVEAVVEKNLGNMVSYVKTSNGYVRRHQNQMKCRSSTSSAKTDTSEWYIMQSPVVRQEDDATMHRSKMEGCPQTTEELPRRSIRVRVRPNRYQPS